MLITSASVCKVHLYSCDTDNDKRFERYAQRQEDNDFYIAYARFPIHHTKTNSVLAKLNKIKCANLCVLRRIVLSSSETSNWLF